jgi:hypothetical protein
MDKILNEIEYINSIVTNIYEFVDIAKAYASEEEKENINIPKPISEKLPHLIDKLGYRYFVDKKRLVTINNFYKTTSIQDWGNRFTGKYLYIKIYHSIGDFIKNNDSFKIKIMLKLLLERLDNSNNFLNSVVSAYNHPTHNVLAVEKDIADYLLTFNKKLLYVLREEFLIIFPDLFSNIKQDSNDLNDSNDKLNDSNIYKIAELLAEGKIKKDKNCFYYNTEKYDSVNALSDTISKVIGLKKTAIQPYINSTLQENNDDKNIFSTKKLKYLELIIKDFEAGKRAIDSNFVQRVEELKPYL